ncbi:ceramide phosphoethanolamine synthase [Bradysia coprophila]|uniref:ceramide phosphoethanolamine synthase n=1 Tax=Bradysia coprophila TaxID=38358 RepID=UPI00187DCA2F|nr:ceramide phosphoethanolamine synthase [Bradysia coprophila]
MVGPSSYISKILLSLLFVLMGWYIFMDINLYLRIQNYPIDRSFHSTNTTIIEETTINHASTIGSIPFSTIESSTPYESVSWISCDINPLCHVTVKALLLDHTNHYLFAPMATIFDNIVKCSQSNWITPNMISFFHVFVAILAAKLIASDSLGYRRVGVVLFQIRTFLDDLDGHVARQKKHIRGERSEIGTTGYYIDGLCDGLGCIALMIGIFVQLKNNPPRRGYTQLQAILPVSDTKNPESGVVYKVKVTTKKVARKVLCFSGQLLLSSTAWNRYIAIYQDILERNDLLPSQYIKQMFVFKSNWFLIGVAWLWRIVNVHSMLHCILLSIFCDKLWEFLRLIQYSGFIILLVCICVTEMHVLDVQNFIFQSLTGNNTSL